MNSRIKDLKSRGTVDILFVGSSHAYRGFDTRIFTAHAITSFNLGSSAQTPLQTEVLVERYLDSLSPKLVVYEVYPATFSIDGVESALDLIANDNNDMQSVRMALRLNHIEVYNTLLFGLFRDLFDLNSDFVESTQNGQDVYINGGFVEHQLSYFDNSAHYSSRTWKLRPYHCRAFERILGKLARRQIPFVLVQVPVTRELYDSYANNSEADEYFMSMGSYYNFNELISLSTTEHFFDADHLNQNGVLIFNNELLKILQDDNMI